VKAKDIRELVRGYYGKIAAGGASCCGSASSSCRCAAGGSPSAADLGKATGYSPQELSSVPEDANLGLGCGNPTALASIREGETVLDLGSGAGFDCFLAARRVGERGRVIGVDMTPEMVEKARENAEQGGYGNVEFRLGEIEHLPAADSSVDLIVSNCVINLAVDKAQVFREAFRVLKGGGRMMISDLVLLAGLPEGILASAAAYAGCLSGASLKNEYLELIRRAGFAQVQVLRESSFGGDWVANDPAAGSLKAAANISDEEAAEMAAKIVSLTVEAYKPRL